MINYIQFKEKIKKRLKQIVSELGKDKGFVLSRNHLLQDKTYKDMVNIIHSEASELSSMSSIKIQSRQPPRSMGEGLHQMDGGFMRGQCSNCREVVHE